jgi:predicted naringenin-chalcone synthase
MSRHGVVFGGGKIYPDGSKHKGNRRIVSKAVAEDGNAAVIKASDWVRESLKAKANKEKYLRHVSCLYKTSQSTLF